MKTNNTYKFNKSLRFIAMALVFLMPFINSCNNKNKQKVEIFGKITNAENQEISLEMLLPGQVTTVAASNTNKNGEFNFKIDSLQTCFYRLKIDEKNFIYLRLKPNDKIEINANYPDILTSYTIQGSEESGFLKDLNMHLMKSTKRLNEINDLLVSAYKTPNYNVDSLSNILNTEAREMYENDKDFLINFIKTHHKSVIIYFALYQYVSISPILIIENDLEIFQFVLDELKKHNPDFQQIALLKSEISKESLRQQQFNREYAKLEIGKPVLDFDLPDINGNRVSLSDFKNKNIVLAFWSSWNKLSLKAIINLSEKLKNNEVVLILIALDNTKEKWEAIVKNNALEKYINLSDLKAWESPVTKIYAIKSIPSFILIDTNRNLVINTDDYSEILDKLN